MKLFIDNREPQQIIKYINALNDMAKVKMVIEVKRLDIGDYILFDEEKNKNLIIIERKSLQDLESSIKDGRYNEQSFRLNQSITHNHNIIYLIEGNIINHRNQNFKSTLYSSLFSLNYYKGFSVFNSVNLVETGEIIYNFANKMLREKNKPGFYTERWVANTILDETENTIEVGKENVDDIDKDDNNMRENDNNYLETLKVAKKSNVTCDNIMELMLMQIPGIKTQTSNAICSKFKTLSELLDGLRENENCLDMIKMASGRSISKTSRESIKKFLLNKK
jgi:ERCC4-type nuclease